MLNRLITTLRKRGAHGRAFAVQATEATQAAELIAGLVAHRDELLEAARRVLEWIEAEDDHTKVPDFWTRAQMCRDAELATRAAIRARGNQSPPIQPDGEPSRDSEIAAVKAEYKSAIRTVQRTRDRLRVLGAPLPGQTSGGHKV